MLAMEDHETVKKGIEILQEKGKVSDLKQILSAYFAQKTENKKLLYELLASIKAKGILEAWMEILKDSSFKEKRKEIINILWNTSLDFSDQLVYFVSLAIELDYMGALECLTVIEQMEGPFNEQQLLEAEVLLKEYFGKPKDESNTKVEMLLLIHHQIQAFQGDVDEDLFDQ